jgi:hypothetical protein
MTDGTDPVSPIETLSGVIIRNGLTKRELFAAMALQGLAANSDNYNTLAGDARSAVAAADELIDALNEPSE